MAVGFPEGKWDIDNRAGTVAKALRDTLREVESFNAWLEQHDDTFLASVGYEPEDITTLRGSFIDLTKLSRISHGQDTQAEANDFFWNAKHLMGPS